MKDFPEPEIDFSNPSVKLPTLEIEDTQLTTPTDELVNTINGSTQYAFIGCGQSGCRIAAEFYSRGYKKTICINTSPQDLSSVQIPAAQKLLLATSGQGAGKNMGVGEEAVWRSRQEIYDLLRVVFGTSTQHVIICIGAGGGTGGGSAVPLMLLAKKYMHYIGYGVSDQTELNKRVGFIMTLPKNSEMSGVSSKVAVNAWDVANGLSELAERGSFSPLLVVDNEKASKLYRNLPVTKYWPTINAGIAGLFDIFNTLSVQHSQYTSFDPADYRSVITAGGHCIMGVTSIKIDSNEISETMISQALRVNLEKTLLADGFDLASAKAMACIVVGGTRMFEEVAGLQEAIEYGFSALASLTSSAVVHRGIYHQLYENPEDEKLKAYIIIGGLQRPALRYKDLQSRAESSYP